MRNLRLHLLLALLIGCGGVKLDPKSPYRVGTLREQVQLTDDVSTEVEITYPQKGAGPHPTVILVPSSGPMDMDLTLISSSGPTMLFSDLADDLSSRGFAVVRYNKRHVHGFREYDLREFVRDDTPKLQAEDLRRIYDAVSSNPRVQRDHIFLYGVGEGAQVAAAVALDRPAAGLLVQGAPGMPYRERMTGWFEELLVPHLDSFGYAGILNGLMLAEALQAPMAPPVKMIGEMLAVSYTRDARVVKISPLVDLNRDGLLELDEELGPRTPDLVDLAFGPIGNLRQHAGESALPTLDQVAGQLTMPVLVLQGMNDATSRPENADRIEAALQAGGNKDATVERFEGVGHTLGVAPNALGDEPRPMAIGPRDRIIAWLVAHAG